MRWCETSAAGPRRRSRLNRPAIGACRRGEYGTAHRPGGIRVNRPAKWRWIVPAVLLVALALSGSSLAAPVGQISEAATPTPSSGPEGIVAGPDGNLWFAEINASKIGEINPATGAISEFPTPTPNASPLGITTGPDGNLWFTEFA